MPLFKPFKAIRPAEGRAERISALPYDVMNRAEAKEMGADPLSFLHISRSEIDLGDSVDPYSPEVYKAAHDNLYRMLDEGSFLQDDSPFFYIYREVMDGRAQTGVVGCASIDDYTGGRIKKHELTRVEKEIDRINHFDACDAHTEPVFLTYRNTEALAALIGRITEEQPMYDFTSDDGVRHTLWVVSNPGDIDFFESELGKIDAFYIADGHHRSASAVKVGLKRRDKAGSFTGDEEFNFFLTVLFPDEDLAILPYNRVVRDLAGLSSAEFLEKLRERFDLEETPEAYAPKARHEIGMYLDGQWYILRPKAGWAESGDVVADLDISILQNEVLGPILKIEDPRTDKRIDFVGGIRGLSELEKRVGSDMKVAFSMYATTIGELLSVADAGKIMPPKSTWFEPKLRSGLFVHSFR
ncbi:MAG: DUF1015 family protein [Clostridiales Family XIII bacterium]|jgi:uncharacterized protein (DUF1015 family)|nr:DUF1015 family protein [Clostridiales Family XIII bacterium]